MNTNSVRERVQEKLDAVTRKWWLYPLLLLPFFIPPYASRSYDPRETMGLMQQALFHPLIHTFPALMPMAKAIPAALIAGVMAFGNRVRHAFNGYVALLYVALACFQNTALTDTYGLIIIPSNLALFLVVALFWMWEVVVGRNDFELRQQPLWKWWVAPLALLAFLAPIDASTMSPDFNPVHLLTNESGLTYCMMTPVILAVLTLYHPTVNLAVLRVSSFVGMMLGAMNMLMWFVVIPSGWWMGVLHIPLLSISIYAFVLAHLGTSGCHKG